MRCRYMKSSAATSRFEFPSTSDRTPGSATRLLEDLVDTLARAEDEPYFLGSVVLVKEPETAGADVIDGQQRLATLTILFALLRDLAGEAELERELDERVRRKKR